MKPMLGLSLHVSMPTCVHGPGAWADAGTIDSTAKTSTASNERLFCMMLLPATMRSIRPIRIGIGVRIRRRRIIWVVVRCSGVSGSCSSRSSSAVPGGSTCGATRDARKRQRRQWHADNVNEDRCGACRTFQIAFENADVERQTVALKLRRFQYDDGVVDG